MSQKDWKEIDATVFTCGVQDHYSPGQGPASISSDYIVTFSYLVDGQYYSGEFNSSEPREEGSIFKIKYDPHDPTRSDYCDARETRWLNWIMYPIGAGLAALYVWFRAVHHR